MSTGKKEKDVYKNYFEERTSLFDQLTHNNKPSTSLDLNAKKQPEFPTWPETGAAEEEQVKKFWKKLRAFFRTGIQSNVKKTDTHSPFTSIHFAGIKNHGYSPVGFPLWLANEETFNKNPQIKDFAKPVGQLIDSAMETLAAESRQASILKDNLVRFQVVLSGLISSKKGPVLFSEIMKDAAKKLIGDLSISGNEGKEFSDDLMSLVEKLPPDGLVVPYSPQTSIILFTTTLKAIFFERRQRLMDEVGRLTRMLKDLILVDDQNRPEAYEPSKLKSSYQFASQLINFNELSGLMPESASETITEERLKRIRSSVNILGNVEDALFKNFATVIVSNHLQTTLDYDWASLFTGCDVIKAKDGQGCATAIKTFNNRMTAVTEVFRAIRIGQLELKRAYDPELHDEYFKHFDWRSFSEQELNACPLIIFLEDSEALIEQDLKSFFDILKSDIPVKTIAIRGMDSSRFDRKRPESAVAGIKQELASLAISHRNAFVLQSAAVDPEFLFNGFRQGLSEYSPGLFHILLPDPATSQVDPYLWISAAVEGRGFPTITYDMQKGAQWGSRFDIGNNPNPESDWPVHQVTIFDDQGQKSAMEIPFTFADFAVLDPSCKNEFLMVPPEYWSDELVLLSDYLNLDDDQVYSSIPFVWMVDESNRLQKVAVSWSLMIACRERLEFWHYIQESCGSRSYHIDQAVHKALQDASGKFQNEITALKQEHQNKIKEIEEETAANTMKRLAEILLDLDTTSESNFKVSDDLPSVKELKEESKEPQPAENKIEEKPEQEQEEEISLGEPWIDSPLCTTCNECIDLNNRMFSYNENKQAYLKDPKAGTFRELVSAAENCPPKIIHPGAPLNPNEEGIEELIKRAEPFN